MSLLTILRVEDAVTGQGPYRIRSDHNADQMAAVEGMTRRHNDFPWYGRNPVFEFDGNEHLHPGPDEDMGWRWGSMTYTRRALDYRFGLPNETRLRQWFFGERDTLELLNMHVAAYEVPHQAVLRGQWQVAFRKPSARLVRTMTLKEAGVE